MCHFFVYFLISSAFFNSIFPELSKVFFFDNEQWLAWLGHFMDRIFPRRMFWGENMAFYGNFQWCFKQPQLNYLEINNQDLK